MVVSERECWDIWVQFHAVGIQASHFANIGGTRTDFALVLLEVERPLVKVLCLARLVL